MAERRDSEGAGVPEAGDWLVVYGSLMRGIASASADVAGGGGGGDLLDRLGVGAGLRRVGACRVSGVLYDLGPYPALRAAVRTDEVVCGELHAVLDPGIFAVLDAFEGFDPADPSGSDYLRERVPLLEPRGRSAWIYVYNRQPDANQRIASGDWRLHLAKRADPPHDPA
ncbi:MAG: gamma-glutamylcyclotransferase [Deltaproteobacteria bacterium]|nr:gamma-glutamylcyclotransferase [Deltaproteobacteria bacterium]